MLVRTPYSRHESIRLAIYDFRGLADRIKDAWPGSVVIYIPKAEKVYFKGLQNENL